MFHSKIATGRRVAREEVFDSSMLESMGFSTKGATVTSKPYEPPVRDYAAERAAAERQRMIERHTIERQQQEERHHVAIRQEQLQAQQARTTAELKAAEERCAQEAATKRGNVPEEYKSKSYIRLPAYTTITPELLREQGYSRDIANALAKNVTGLRYDANWENERKRQEFERDPNNAGKTYIPKYEPDSQKITSAANPEGSGPYGRAHKDKNRPEGQDHFSIEEAQKRLAVQFSRGTGSGMQVTVTKLLDLPENKQYVSQMNLEPTTDDYLKKGAYNVEISFTMSGQQQISIKNEDIETRLRYTNTKPISEL